MTFIKKSVLAALIISMLTSMLCTINASAKNSTFTDVGEETIYYDAVERLGILGIVNGYEDNTYRPSNNVTRAEFCKIVVMILDKEKESKMTPPTSSFDDVNRISWCIPYVNYLISSGAIKGYTDGTFKPDNIITYAEAVTILCRVLGYTEEHVGYSWPVNFINQAEALELTDGMVFGANDAITRGAMAIIADNTLFCDIKITAGTQSVDKKFIETVGYTVLEDTYITATSNENSDLKSNEVMIGQSKYECVYDDAYNMIGIKGTAVMNSDNELVVFIPEANKSIFDIETKEDYLTLESLGYTVLEDCFITATKNEESSLNPYQIRTSNGVYEVENEEILNKVNSIGTLVLNSKGRAVIFNESDLYSEAATVTKATDNYVEYQVKGGQKASYTFSQNFVVYYDNNKSTYQAQKGNIKNGTNITFYGDENGSWSFAVVDDTNSTIIPVRATKNYTGTEATLEGKTIDYDGLTVYKDNKTVNVSDIEVNDVIYYNTNTNVMDVYDKKITGIYNEAMPSKAYVTSVNVGGNIYSINQNVSTSSLDASNTSFAIGERVTLLLGENDEVCFAVELAKSSSGDYGVVLQAGKETATSGENEGSSTYYVSLIMADGNTYKYDTKKNYDSYVGELVRVGYDDGLVLTKTSSSNVYGTINKAERTVGGKTVLKDVAIFNRLSEDDADIARVEVLDFDTLDASEINIAQLISSISTNDFGDVGVFYVKDMATSYHYGLIRGIEKSDGESTRTIYKIFADSVTADYVSEAYYQTATNAVGYKLNNANQIEDLKVLTKLVSANSVGAVEEGRILINSKIYKLAQNVEIIDTTNLNNYRTISVDELASSKVKSIVLYTDKNLDSSSLVRVITVTLQKL